MASWKLEWWCIVTSFCAAVLLPIQMAEWSIVTCHILLYSRKWWQVLSIESRWQYCHFEHLSVFTGAIVATDLLFYLFNGRKAFFHLHLVCMLCWRSINAEWCISTASKTIIFHSCRFSPQSFSFLLVSACARVWNIYEGARDGAPFKDLPLWLWIRAFSTCTE